MSLNPRQLTPRQLRKQLERQWRRSSGKRVKITGSARGKAYLLTDNQRRYTTHGRPLPSIEIQLFQNVSADVLRMALGLTHYSNPREE